MMTMFSRGEARLFRLPCSSKATGEVMDHRSVTAAEM